MENTYHSLLYNTIFSHLFKHRYHEGTTTNNTLWVNFLRKGDHKIGKKKVRSSYIRVLRAARKYI